MNGIRSLNSVAKKTPGQRVKTGYRLAIQTTFMAGCAHSSIQIFYSPEIAQTVIDRVKSNKHTHTK